ncbi:helix-turn-helix transcriptional regulator [Mucilaginibacter sp. KACC 22773]|uniref:helix-turn-helix domain-containing protein n=1 Tax=Mucilaginibacter sp. KACC 22773 TaxID=3025671 RepID=UPI002365952E|nr:helix-turn-helix transcriptional regulator [Mucilaginibacter sp. KACC 22773]WDF80693.1 helix-turn-helix transcriptional regulator [Mucilaginibacter sp. KACC 22773]
MSISLHFSEIADVYKFFNLHQSLKHPLVAVIDFSNVDEQVAENTRISCDYYCLLFKRYDGNNVKYGRKVVDFNNGSLMCIAPNQVLDLETDIGAYTEKEGWGVFFHPDLIRGTSLHDKMKDYSFFSYEVWEALHMSEKEKSIFYDCVQKLDNELHENIDTHSQSVIVSHIELLLNYCARFYGRQFITRKSANSSVVMQVEKILRDYFSKAGIKERGLPSVKNLADKVNLSPGYLSDLLKKETGKNAQDHIHYYLIEEAKNILINTDKSVGEVAYLLGFEYPQYFNKLFKQKTGKTPVEFRNMD